MTLEVKPKGRGNWAVLTLKIEGRHLPPLLVRVGQTLMLGGVEFKIVGVFP